MDFSHCSQATVVTAIFAFLTFLCSLALVSRNASKKKSTPKAGGAWPMIGHVHLFQGPEPPFRVLTDMADKYGPIFTINMGVHRALVVSNWEIAKECLTTNDGVFANRPKSLAMELMSYNFSLIGMAPYGPYWRQVRKIATVELLSNHRLEKLKHVRESELRTSLKELFELCLQNKCGSSNMALVEMKRWFEDITLNVILRMVVGKRCTSWLEGAEKSDTLREGIKNFFEWSGKFVVSDALPFLKWLDIGGAARSMKKTAKELDIFMQECLDEHKRKRVSDRLKAEEDFMDVMLSTLEDPKLFPGRDADTVIKATCLTMILGATDTTTVTLVWALSLLLNNPGVLKKAKNELDLRVGRERQVNDSDISNLPYLQAILMETMRLYPAGPLTAPRYSTEDCIVSGHHVPAGTRLFVNLWQIHRDPRVWSDPHAFQPERYLTTHKHFDVRGQNFEYMPFSSGRRMCPGASFALQVMQLTLAGLLQGFDFATPSDEPVDMSEGTGLIMFKKAPLQVQLTPRLSASLYG